jgi:hypothetical protein
MILLCVSLITLMIYYINIYHDFCLLTNPIYQIFKVFKTWSRICLSVLSTFISLIHLPWHVCIYSYPKSPEPWYCSELLIIFHWCIKKILHKFVCTWAFLFVFLGDEPAVEEYSSCHDQIMHDLERNSCTWYVLSRFVWSGGKSLR